MKQTAVEWLEIQLFKKQGKFTKSDIEQAKAMEKEQIVDAFEHVDFSLDDGLHYYEQTFKSE